MFLRRTFCTRSNALTAASILSSPMYVTPHLFFLLSTPNLPSIADTCDIGPLPRNRSRPPLSTTHYPLNDTHQYVLRRVFMCVHAGYHAGSLPKVRSLLTITASIIPAPPKFMPRHTIFSRSPCFTPFLLHAISLPTTHCICT